MSEITWDQANIVWSNNPYSWDEIRLAGKVFSTPGPYLDKIEKLTDEEKTQFIELIVKVKGNQEYSSPHIYTEKKPVKTTDIKVTVDDVKLVLKEVLGINLEIDNIHV